MPLCCLGQGPAISRVQLFINNKFIDAKSGKKIPVIDPRTEKTIFEVDEGGLEDVDAAVQAASEAFTKGPWPKTAAAVSHPLVAYFFLFDARMLQTANTWQPCKLGHQEYDKLSVSRNEVECCTNWPT